jgi:hypothetical protein
MHLSCTHQRTAPTVVPTVSLPAQYCFEEALGALFEGRFYGLAIKDLPRLARRTVVVSSGEEPRTLLPLPNHPEPVLSGQHGAEATRDLCLMFWHVAQLLEPEETIAALRTAIQGFLVEPSRFQPDMVASDLLTLVGKESSSAAVLRLINQAVVLEGMLVLRASDKGGMLQYCRDLREARGWRILVDVSSTAVHIMHERTEVAGNPALGDVSKFELTWRLTMSLSSDAKQFESADLRVSHLEFTEHTDLRTRLAVGRAFCNGNLIIA